MRTSESALSSIFGIDSKFSSTAVQSVDFTAEISTILDIIRAECWVSHEFRKKFATGNFRRLLLPPSVECHLIVLPSNSFNPSSTSDNSRFWNPRSTNFPQKVSSRVLDETPSKRGGSFVASIRVDFRTIHGMIIM